MIDERWITTREAASLLDVSIQHVSWLLRHGIIQGEKFGFFWLVDRDSVGTYAATERKRGPKPKDVK